MPHAAALADAGIVLRSHAEHRLILPAKTNDIETLQKNRMTGILTAAAIEGYTIKIRMVNQRVIQWRYLTACNSTGHAVQPDNLRHYLKPAVSTLNAAVPPDMLGPQVVE